jgi:hypothetical protein
MKCLGLHNKPMAEVHPGHMLTGPKKEEDPNVYTELHKKHHVLRLTQSFVFSLLTSKMLSPTQ